MKIVALAGGVGGAKLADGLAQVLKPDELSIIVNTADDFIHLGLRISPDLDTVCYTLAGVANPRTGWGLRDETWNLHNQLQKMNMPGWFHVGDKDLATHIIRSYRLSQGWSLSKITQEFCKLWGIHHSILPMSDDLIQTLVHTNEGDLEFQEYFVHRMCEPIVKGFTFIGIEKSTPAPGVVDLIDHADAIVICPSNSWVSIDPILFVPGIRAAIVRKKVIAISPIIGGKTFKGPAAKMYSELGIEPSVIAIANHFGDIIDGLVIDHEDAILGDQIDKMRMKLFITDILMRDIPDRGRLAKEVLNYINMLGIR